MIVVVVFAVAGAAAVVLSQMVQRRTGMPSAVVLVLVGLVYGLLPGPNLQLHPEVVLVLVLPPLLYWTALNASLLEIRSHLRPVLSLAVGLVLVTALAVGAGLALVVPGLPLAAAIALGAAVAPPDPVASLAIGRRAGLPPRLITVLEGEGLLNDATAITAFQVAVAAAIGSGFSVAGASAQFVLSAAGGTAAGLGVAWVTREVRRRINDQLAENAVSLATPFLAYLLAEQLHASGLLAVVVAGLWIGHQGPTFVSGPSRLQTRAVWRLVNYLLEGFVFLLIGNQLPAVVGRLSAYPVGTVVAATAVTLAGVLLVRPLWIALTAQVPGRRTSEAGMTLTGREVVALSWAGTRGVISLAAAFALPLSVGGSPLPYRDLLLFCAYAAVLATLVLQGLTFAPLVRALKLRERQEDDAALAAAARVAAVEAGLRRLEARSGEQPVPDGVVAQLRGLAEIRRQRGSLEVGDGQTETAGDALSTLRHEMIEAERQELLRWRDAGRLSGPTLRALERELDHEEGLLRAVL